MRALPDLSKVELRPQQPIRPHFRPLASADIGQALLQSRKLDKANVEAAAHQERRERMARRRSSGPHGSGGRRDSYPHAHPRKVLFDEAKQKMEADADREKAHEGRGFFGRRKSHKVGVDTTKDTAPTAMDVAVDMARRSSRSSRNSFSLQSVLTLEP